MEEAPFATAERAVATMDVQPAVMSGKRTQADEWAERQRQAEKKAAARTAEHELQRMIFRPKSSELPVNCSGSRRPWGCARAVLGRGLRRSRPLRSWRASFRQKYYFGVRGRHRRRRSPPTWRSWMASTRPAEGAFLRSEPAQVEAPRAARAAQEDGDVVGPERQRLAADAVAEAAEVAKAAGARLTRKSEEAVGRSCFADSGLYAPAAHGPEDDEAGTAARQALRFNFVMTPSLPKLISPLCV